MRDYAMQFRRQLFRRLLGDDPPRGAAAIAGLLLSSLFETLIRLVIFAVPVGLVAQYCDVAPTWKTAAFVMFFSFWFDCVFGARGDRSFASRAEPDASRKRNASVPVLTPAQVAEEARKLTPAYRPAASR